MATRYTLDARITGTNETGPAFEGATNNANEFARALREIPNEINVRIDLENVSNDIEEVNTRLAEGINDVTVGISFESVTNDITALNRRIQEGVKDVQVGVDFENVSRDVAALNTRLAAAIKDQKVEVKVDYDRSLLGALARDSGVAARSLENLTQSEVDVGQAAIRSANVLRSSGFLILLGGIGTAAYAAGPALQAAVGGAIAIGSAAASSAVGAGLLGTAIYRLVQAAKDGDKFTGDLRREWEKLRDQFTGDRSVFDKAAKDLAPLAADILRLANRTMPDLGREADEVARSFRRAANQIEDGWGTHERNSVLRLLDNASNSIHDITQAVGRLGGGLANIIGSPAAVRAAKEFTGYLDDISGDFRDWSRTEKAREGIARWLDRAKDIGKGVADVFGDIGRALGRFDDEDAKNVADAVRAIGHAAAFAIDEVRKAGRGLSDFARWAGDATNKLDALGDKMAGQKHTYNSFWHDLTDPAVTPDGVGRKLEKYLNVSLPDALDATGDEMKQNAKVVGDWADKQKSSTNTASNAWGANVDKDITKGDLPRNSTMLDNNQKMLDKWQKNHEDSTRFVDDSWEKHVMKSITNFILPGFGDALKQSGNQTGDWQKGQSNNTSEADKSWEQHLVKNISKNYLNGTYADALGNAAKATQNFVQKVESVLGDLLDWLGLGGGGDGGGGSDQPITGGGGHPSTGGGSHVPSGGGGGGGNGSRADPTIVGRLAMGGIAGPGGAGLAIAGEAGEKEAVVNLERYTAASAHALKTALDEWGERGWLERLDTSRGGPSHKNHDPDDLGPVGQMAKTLQARRGAAGFGPTTHDWTSEVAKYAAETRRHVGHITTNTYPNHGGRGEWGEEHSVDHWGPGGRGDHIARSTGEQVVSWVTSHYPIMYYIWRGLIHGFGGTKHYSDPNDQHFDHVHVTYDGGGAPGVSDAGGGPSAIDWFAKAMDWLQSRLPTPDLGLGPYGEQASEAMLAKVMPAIEQWVRNHVPSGSGDGYTPSGKSPKGLTIDEAVTRGGWPKSKHNTAVGVAWEESGGNVSSNATAPYRGLFAMGRDAFQEVGMNFSNWRDPIYNSTAAAKLQAKMGWSPWQAYPPSSSSMHRGNTKITGYTNGGFADRPMMASVAEHGSEFFMPLHDPRSAARFMDFLDRAASERRRRGPQGADPGNLGGGSGGVSHPAATERTMAMVHREMREVKHLLKQYGIKIDLPSIDGIGKAAGDGAIRRVLNDPAVQRAVNQALSKTRQRTDSAHGRRG